MKHNNETFDTEKYQKGVQSIIKKNYKLAEKIFCEILAKFPNHLNSIFLTGFSLYEQKKNIKSLKYLIKASSLKKNFRDADYFIGKIYQDLKQFEKAEQYFQKIFDIYIDDLETLINLVKTKINLKKFEDADILLKNNKKLFKNDEIYENLFGYLYLHSGKNNLSIKHYLESLKRNNKNLDTLINLAYVYLRLTDLINSEKYFKKALSLNPNNPNTLFAYSYYQLHTGKLREGLIKYEYRKVVNNYNKKLFNNYEEWNGQNLDNKTILILSEQGIGDIIQFSRYIFFIRNKYKVKIIFQTKKSLFHLFKDEGLDLREGKGELPFFDYFIFLMSLPKVIFFKENIFIQNYNFIKINQDNYLKWNIKFKNIKGKKIGISWQGDKYYLRDSMRSVNLRVFEPLFENKNLNFINLQNGYGIEQLKKFKYVNKFIDFSDEIDQSEKTFEDTISIIKNLDLIITVDSALSHLAGTMEMDTWMLQHHNPEWRWQLQSNKFKWYPKHKFFRQGVKDDWNSVISEINKNLNKIKLDHC